MTTPSNDRLKELAEKWANISRTTDCTKEESIFEALHELRDEMEKEREGDKSTILMMTGQIQFLREQLAAAEQRIGELTAKTEVSFDSIIEVDKLRASLAQLEESNRRLAMDDSKQHGRVLQLEAQIRELESDVSRDNEIREWYVPYQSCIKLEIGLQRLTEALRVLVEAAVPMLETVAMRRRHNTSKDVSILKAEFLAGRGWIAIPFIPKGSDGFIAPTSHPYQKWNKNGADGKITEQALKLESRWDTDNFSAALSRVHAILKEKGGQE
jgi:hypothetical protein